MINFEELFAAAYKKERASSSRLARDGGMSEQDALIQILQKAVGKGTLADLVAGRLLASQQAAALVTARKREQAETRARRLNKVQPDATAWLGWFDGAAKPNPGKIGIGGLLQSPTGERVEISSDGGHGSSSDAEYLALIAVLEAAVSLQPERLLLFGDSQVVINDLNAAGTLGAHGLRQHRERAAALLVQLPEVTLEWIPRHRNSAADALSQRALREHAVQSG